MMNSLMPCAEYIFMMCHRIGLPPISIMGFGLRCVSSEMRVPSPPTRITAFIEMPPPLDGASLDVVVGLEAGLLDQAVALRRRVVGGHHLGDELFEGRRWRPSELPPGLGRVAEQRLDFRGAVVETLLGDASKAR